MAVTSTFEGLMESLYLKTYIKSFFLTEIQNEFLTNILPGWKGVQSQYVSK